MKHEIKYNSYREGHALKPIKQHQLSKFIHNQKSMLSISTSLDQSIVHHPPLLSHLKESLNKYKQLSHPSIVKVEDAFIDMIN